jgi:predicted alpha-1,2-mannosidase
MNHILAGMNRTIRMAGVWLLLAAGTNHGLAVEPATQRAAGTAPVLLANPLQGTDSNPSFSHGNTYPAIALPFPMNTWTPYTQPQPDSFYYQYRHLEIRGIRETHQPSAWIPEYGAFALMPVSGKLVVSEADRVSTFDHANEVAQPSYYKVRLDTWKTTVELTPTERAARFRFTFDSPGNSYVVLDLFPSEKDSSVTILPDKHTLIGVARNNRGAVPDNFGNYFVLDFDRSFAASGVWSDDSVQAGATNLQGRHVGAFLRFDTRRNHVVECRVASSFISLEQARRNLDREIGRADFETIRQRAAAAWNETLGRARVEGGTEEMRRTFYSALYRSVLFPHRFYERDAANQPVYYSPYDGQIHSGYAYTDTGYWDTFRAALPLYNLLYPEVSSEIVQGVLNAHRECGWLPQWSSPGWRNAMMGNHAFSLLADAWVKNVRPFDLQEAAEAIKHDAHGSAIFGHGREGCQFFDQLGYIPYPELPDATSKTLDYAYDDFCAAVISRAAGRPADTAAFARSAMNYTNVFDPTTGFMRGRKKDGTWCAPFDPVEWGGPFVEGNAWQWTWSVMHDVPGLIQLLGGEAAFNRKLDGLFAAGSEVKVGTYHGLIHEMNEMAAQGLGQYDHGNEPAQHVPYLYDWSGQPWKTQFHVRQVMSQLYQSTPDGLPGDEDNGQMSAWYVFSALGFYPVCPGTDVYLLGSPIFDRATLNLGASHQFVITARDNGPQRPYIRSAALNGQPFNRVFLTHGQIAAGGELRLNMDSSPNPNWAIGPDDRPPAPIKAVLP